jgi:predicted nuclease with TOPRIM domain
VRDALKDELVELHAQLLARDTEFREFDERVAALKHEKEAVAEEMDRRLQEAATQIRNLSETIDAMQQTRIWRLGARYWSMRDWVVRWVRR